MDGVTRIDVLWAPATVPDFGLKSNQLGDAEPTAANLIGVDVRFETVKDCGCGTAPGPGGNSRPVGVTPGGAAVPAGTMLKTIEIDMEECMASVGVRVTAP